MKKIIILITAFLCFQSIYAQLTVSTTNGNVGIKDSSPEQALTIAGNTTSNNFGTNYFMFNNQYSGTLSPTIDFNGFRWLLPNQSYTGSDTVRFYQLYNYAEDKLFFDTDNSFSNGALMTIQHNGNIGIGTATPLNRFHVNGDAFFNSSGGDLKFGFPTGNGWGFYTSGSGANLHLQNYTNTSTEAGGATRITFKNNGTNGFGTSSPVKVLHAQATADGGALRLTRSASTVIMDAGAETSNAFVGTSSSHDFRLVTNGSNRIHIKADGKVGIGTTNPLNLLQVNGDAIFNSSIGNLKFGFPTSDGWGLATTGGGSILYMYSYTNTSTEDGQAHRITFNSNGTNGFGVVSPAKALHAESSGPGGALRLTRSGSSVMLDAGSEINEGFIGTSSNHNFRLLSNGAVRIHISADGNVGIGTTTPSFPLEVTGDAYITGDLTVASDRNLKKDIQPIESALATIGNLNPVSYYYKTDEYPSMKLSEKQKMGLIAQELEQVLPNLVSKAGTVTHTNGEVVPLKSVNYLEMIPVLIKAVQELEEKVTQRDKLIETLLLQLTKVEALASELERMKGE